MLESSVAIDHRPRVAAERRARMRRKLVESALLVFADKGVDASVIEDVIAAAGVSRGTFYNYFRTNGELLAAAIDELGNEVVDLIESRVKATPSPAARLITGLRLYLEASRRFPLFAKFIARVGPQSLGPDNLVFKYIPIHIAEGIEFRRIRRRARSCRSGHGCRRWSHRRRARLRRARRRGLHRRNAFGSRPFARARPRSNGSAHFRTPRPAGARPGFAGHAKPRALSEAEAPQAGVAAALAGGRGVVPHLPIGVPLHTPRTSCSNPASLQPHHHRIRPAPWRRSPTPRPAPSGCRRMRLPWRVSPFRAVLCARAEAVAGFRRIEQNKNNFLESGGTRGSLPFISRSRGAGVLSITDEPAPFSQRAEGGPWRKSAGPKTSNGGRPSTSSFPAFPTSRSRRRSR